MTDSTTSTIRLTQPTIGADGAGAWPTILNNNMTYTDEAINQTVIITVADTNATLLADGSSSDQARYQQYSIGGSWTADRTITLPNNVKIGTVINATSGGHNLVLTTGSGSTITVPPDNTRVRFEVDGVGNVTSPVLSSGSYTLLGTNGNTFQAPGGLIFNFGHATTAATGSGASVAVTWQNSYPTGLLYCGCWAVSTGVGIAATSGPGTNGATFLTYNTSTLANLGSEFFYFLSIGH